MTDNGVSVQLEQGQGQRHDQLHCILISKFVPGQVQGDQALAILQLLYIACAFQLVSYMPCYRDSVLSMLHAT